MGVFGRDGRMRGGEMWDEYKMDRECGKECLEK